MTSYLLILADIVVTTFAAYVAMRNAHWVSRVLGEIGTEIITKIFGLILGAIAIRFICEGLLKLLPGLS